MVFFFFFKQKTAYEMRISDWSSDVCSSDLNGLAPIHLDIWNGFISLNFADTPEVSLREFLAGLDVMLDGAPFDQFPFYMQVTTEIDCNWKNLVNAFNEGYHVAVLHQKTDRKSTRLNSSH